MTKNVARLKVILASAVTWIGIGVFALAQVSDVFPTTAGWIAKVSALALGIVAVIRRVTPVIPSERGILPPPVPHVDI
jgi:hypothetical protein